MDKTKQIAQTSSLNKALATLLSGFEKSKAWTDIGAWLFKVEQTLKEFPSPFITEKLGLAKRLAQCLNPGLHQAINQQSLKVYELIFETMKSSVQGNSEEYKKMFCEDIGIYSVGLFPFFQNAHQKNKHIFLEIIRNYYVPVGRDLIPSLPGLVLAIMPGLEEQSEILVKDITKTLDALLVSVGRRYFIGSVWMGIMRSQRGREQGIKYLMKLIPKMKSEEGEDEDDDNADSSDISDDEDDDNLEPEANYNATANITIPVQTQEQLQQQQQPVVQEQQVEQQLQPATENLEQQGGIQNVELTNEDQQAQQLLIQSDPQAEFNSNGNAAAPIYEESQINNNQAEVGENQENLEENGSNIIQPETTIPLNAQPENYLQVNTQELSPIQSSQVPVEQNPQSFNLDFNNNAATVNTNIPLNNEDQGIVNSNIQNTSEQSQKIHSQQQIQNAQTSQNNQQNIVSSGIKPTQPQYQAQSQLPSNITSAQVSESKPRPQQSSKSALEMAFQQEVAQKIVVTQKKPDFSNAGFIRENLKYIEEDINLNSDEINFPNKSTLILSTILSCLEDEKQMVRRNILDFMIAHLRITHPILTPSDRLVLVEGVLNQLIRKDASVTRRVNIWLFGKPDMDNKYSIVGGREFVVELIIEAFKRIFTREQKDPAKTLQPLKIMQTFYMEHDHMLEMTISQLAISIVRYIFQYSSNLQIAPIILKAGIRFMENISCYFGQLLKSLADEAVKQMELKKDEETLEIINLLDFTYSSLLGKDQAIELAVERDCVKETLARLCYLLSLLNDEEIMKFQMVEAALKVIHKLLEKLEVIEKDIKKNQKKEKAAAMIQLSQLKSQISMQQQLQQSQQLGSDLKTSQQQLTEIDNNTATNNLNLGTLVQSQTTQIQALVGSSYLQQSLQNDQQQLHHQGLTQEEIQTAVELDEGAEKFFLFYERLCNLLEKFKANTLYKLASLSVVKIQKFLYDKKSMTALPQWFKCISSSIKIANPNISLIAIESMIEIMISERIDPIYEQLKSLIIEEAKMKYSSKNQVVAGNDYTKLTLEKLWSLLDFQHFYDRIIDLIINFSKYFPQYFKEVVVSSFQAVSITEKEASIRRFAVFWRLTANHQSQFLLSELIKVGLFSMLEFLDHENPLIRHASKNWLMESVPQFYRIIDPLFEVLLQANYNWYVSDSLQLFYPKEYNASKVNEMFRKLKSILVTGSDVFLKYIAQYELSPLLLEEKSHITDQTQAVLIKRTGATFSYFSTLDASRNNINASTSIPNQSGNANTTNTSATSKITQLKMSYLDLLIMVCLRYIQGQALESLSLKFQVENAAVNASACEFLELMITQLEDSLLSLALCEYLMEPLLCILNHCIINKDYVMQVQLLNVFRIIFFHSSYIKKNGVELIRFKLVQTLSHKLFIPNILNGLAVSIPYVRSQFISFISSCIPLLSAYLIHPTLTTIIQQIMFSYFSLIKHLATTPAQENDDSMITLSKTQIIKEPSLVKTSKIVLLIQTQEVVKEDSNIYEIHTVLEGVRTILQFYLKIRTLEEIQSTNKDTSEGSFMNIMKTVLTLGIAGDPINLGDKDQNGRVVFTQHTETCSALLQDIKQVVELFVNSWQTSPDFLIEFTSFGIRPYQLMKYTDFNKKLPEMIKNAENDKQRVKILIISIIKPLIYDFPLELMNSFVSLWFRECALDPPSSHSDFGQNEFLKKLVAMLTILNIPNELFLNSLAGSIQAEKIAAFYRIKNPREGKGVYSLNYEFGQLETNILYFLYVYLAYTQVDPAILKRDNLLNLWNLILKFLKTMQPSHNPNTVMWMLDLLYMLSEKYSPKELVSQESKFKSELHDLINEKLMFLSGWVAHSFQIKLNEPPFFDAKYRSTIAQSQQYLTAEQQSLLQALQSTPYKIIAPYAPTQYELSLAFFSSLHIQEHAPKNVATAMKELAVSELDSFIFFDKSQSNDESGIIDKYRLLILETLKALSYNLLTNTYSPERTDRVVVRVKEYVEPLYLVIDNKTSANTQYLESSSELICGLLQQAPQLFIREFKRGVLETFNKDNFFSCNRTTLRYWGKIIDWVGSASKRQNIFQEYLDKVGLQAGFFQKEGTENKRKVKAFKRICFVIFYGAKDKYKDHLKLLLDRIADVIKSTDNSHSSLLILILFCLRILILRLSQNNLNDLFKQIWPMLLTLLIQIYSKPQPGSPPRNPNLMLAGLKLVETLSVAQLDEFFLHQWMFAFDYFGINIQNISVVEKESQLRQRGQLTEAQLRQLTKISPFHYQPCVSSCLNEQDLTVRYINSSHSTSTNTTAILNGSLNNINASSFNFGFNNAVTPHNYDDQFDQQHNLNNGIPNEAISYVKEQRKIIMTQCKVDDENELKNHALALCQYLIYNNEHRTEVDLMQLEQLIEDDFINLDEFILKV